VIIRGVRELDHITGVKITGQGLILPGRVRLPDPVSCA
jgi:hypothetical protein